MPEASEAWASTRSWGDDEPLTRRDAMGRKIVTSKPAEKPAASAAPTAPASLAKEFVRVAGHNDLMKRVVKIGDGSRGAPPGGARITMHTVGHLPIDKAGAKATGVTDGIKFYSTRERILSEDASLTTKESNASTAAGPHTFVLGAGSVLPAWELVAPTMLVGEVCEILVSPEHAYGAEGAPHLGVPPNCQVGFVLELLEWKAPRAPREPMDDEARFGSASELKFRGTELFKQLRFELALEMYDDAAYYLSDGFFGAEAAAAASSIEHPTALAGATATEHLMGATTPGPPPERFAGRQDEAKALLLACLLNAAQCALKHEAWREAEARASKALSLEKANVKALFRRGTARSKMGDYADARADLRRACELDPRSREVREMFDECKVAEAAEKRAVASFYANTGAASGGYEAPPAEAPEKLFVC